MVIKYMKKKCNICGHIVTTGAVMCEYCGNKIDISDTGRDKIKISSRTLLIINLLLFIIGCITVYICFKFFLSFKKQADLTACFFVFHYSSRFLQCCSIRFLVSASIRPRRASSRSSRSKYSLP